MFYNILSYICHYQTEEKEERERIEDQCSHGQQEQYDNKTIEQQKLQRDIENARQAIRILGVLGLHLQKTNCVHCWKVLRRR